MNDFSIPAAVVHHVHQKPLPNASRVASVVVLTVALGGCGEGTNSTSAPTTSSASTSPTVLDTTGLPSSAGPTPSQSTTPTTGPTGANTSSPTTTGATGGATTGASGASTSSAAPTTTTAPMTSTGASTTSTGETFDTTTLEPSSSGSEPPNETQTNSPGPVGCDSLLLCEDFEGVAAGSPPDPAKWSLVANYTYDVAQSELVQVSTEKKHGGNQALHVAANGLAGAIAEIPAQSFYLRAYMQVDAAPLGPVLAGIGTDHNSELRFRIQQNSWATINIIPGDAVLPQAARDGNCPDCPSITPNEWFCMEFFVDSAAKTAGLWIDEVEVFNGAVTGEWPSLGNPVHVRLGTMDLQGGSTGLWVDDVAVGETRVGCE